ncbi:hypothetical protein D3H55_20445 [Bacillus salacetis]|uniref:Uncharacterized protein n=1 Tax=Bacillus salacetis TaxID=2315464 RepID=A0A3A1QPC4_9BACI|nr:hypothetical protein [Bacillus salacetis]RIW28937.1 hypothetical protein D3H55_20445 [Bacillus salacetis]
MTGNTTFFLIGAFLLLFLLPFFVLRDMKNGKKPADIFTSNIMLFVLFLVSVGEVLRSILSSEAMVHFNQTLFLFIIIFVVSPLLFILFYHLRSDMKKWRNPEEYKYYWVYKFRYIFITVLAIVFAGALYRFYLIYEIVFG